MDPLQAKANYSRVCHLLVDKGGDVLRRALHVIHPPSTLAAVLNVNKRALSKIRYSVISPAQWELLFPATGSPDSNNFDITLLTILLRNICGLPSPAAGWNVMPAVSDTSISANIARIKIFRNEVYGHVASAQLDDTTFEKLWQEISKPLVNLGIPQHDIDKLKNAPLTPEEESYAEKLKEWKELEDARFANLQKQVVQLRTVVENLYPSQIDRLAKFDFTGKIKNLCEKFQPGTRKWFFDKLSSWFCDEEASVMILTAGPGVGKSVLSAKICQLYQQRGHLAAYHFCDYTTSDYADPHRILQSLASQMSENIDEFRNKLAEGLCREHSRDSLSDAFRVLLNDPLQALSKVSKHEPMLIVVDALDESKTAIKSEFLDLISSEFSQLPKWIKIFISSRPELQVRKKLEHLNPLEILPDDHEHKLDLEHFIECRLRNISEYDITSLQGSFLYAYYLVNELNQLNETEQNINDYIPKGISGFYEKQFERLKTCLQRYKQDTGVSIFNSFVNVVAASRVPLPFKIIFACMGLSGEVFELRQTIIGIMSEILPVYDDCLTVYHKSLWDWLTLNGYEEHAYAADVADGNKRLWRACKNVYRNIDSLSSVSDFQISSEERFAFENGEEYFGIVGNQEDVHWLVNVNVNFLTLEFYQCLCGDVVNILQKYKAGLPDHLFRRLIQHYTFSKIMRHLFEESDNDCEELCYTYLQYCAIGHVGIAENTITCKNTARDILDKTSKIWLEEITNETNSSFKIISHAAFDDFDIARVSSSPDNKLLVRSRRNQIEVFELPSLRVLFQLDVSEVRRVSACIAFCPDSSYFLRDTLQTCVSIKKQKELPFFPQGPGEIFWCSFFSCGTKLVTVEREFIKVWDVRKKEVLVENMLWECSQNDYCFLSSCNSYIFVSYYLRYGDITVFESTTLKMLEIKEASADICLTNYNDCVHIICPSPFSHHFGGSRIGISRRCQLPTGEIVLAANKYCSKPFMWKGRKCVVCLLSPEGALSLLVCDFINQKVVDSFQISCLPIYKTMNYISNLGEKNFLICLNDSAFVLSLETPSESFFPPFLGNAEHFIYPALSPDSSYVALCYGHPIMTIMNVDNGKTLQTVVPKQKPRACWWSELHLWVICDGLEVIRYPYVSTHPKVLGNVVEECFIDCKGYLLEFAQGVLVTKLKENGKISISKICDEKLCPQQILDSNFNTSDFSPNVAISSDGCAVLLYLTFYPQYELWEIGCEDRWELFLSGRFDDRRILYGCLTGTQKSRSFLLVTDRYGGLHRSITRYVSERNSLLSSIHFENDMRGAVLTLPASWDDREIIYADCKILICLRFLKIVFIDVSNGKVITSIYAGMFDHYFFSAQERVLLLILGNIITGFKIHNIEKYLSF